MLKKSNQKGFTIIEVLIVLAIAGLIMLIVFLAVPALQRNQRNTARTADASKFAAAVNQCITNNNGKVGNCKAIDTTTGVGFIASEYDQLITTPNHGDSVQALTSAAATVATTSKIAWGIGFKCDGATPTTTGAGTRDYVVVYKTESGGSNSNFACVQG